MKLYINDISIDLPKGFKIPRTKQVNDIAEIKDRQSNFSQRIKLPKTKKNIKSFEYLGLIGNHSKLPFKTNGVQLFNSSGGCEIFEGYAVIFKTNKFYEIAIYDGYVLFSKAIENKSLTDLDLSDLNHLKNVTNVVNTWNGATNYRYNVADYNGKMVYDSSKLNLDYLIPSVRCSWLIQKIQEFSGYTFTGSIWSSEEFQELWLTYPKTIGDDTQVTTLINTWNWDGTEAYYNTNPNDLTVYKSDSFTSEVNGTPIDNQYIYTSIQEVRLADLVAETITINQNGYYKITVSGNITKANELGNPSEKNIEFVKIVNGELEIDVIKDNVVYAEEFTSVIYKQLNAGDVFYINGARPYANSESFGGDVDITLSIVIGNQVDFEEAFIDFSITDFMKEILWRFSLTPFKDNYSKTIDFLTLDEWLLTEEVEDWSSYNNKFSFKKDEKYIFGSWAQENYFKYKYNDSNADYNNSSFNISNVNLKDSKTAIQSKTYSPEKEQTYLINDNYNVYKFWNKEVKDDGSVNYKELQKRFYFQRSKLISGSLTVGSELHSQEQAVLSYYREDFSKSKWSDIVLERYKALNSIFLNTRVVYGLIYLNDHDVLNIDFKKSKYIRELGGYYKLNKLPNYTSKGLYECELLRVQRDFDLQPTPQAEPRIVITSGVNQPLPPSTFNHSIYTNYQFQNYAPTGGTIKATQVDNGVPTGLEYTDTVNVSQSSITIVMPNPLGSSEGDYEVQITDSDGLESNVQLVTVSALELPPAISFTVLSDLVADSKATVFYSFENFSPLTAAFYYQKFDFMTQTPIGTEQQVALITSNTQQEIQFPQAGYYKTRIEAEGVISIEQGYFII